MANDTATFINEEGEKKTGTVDGTAEYWKATADRLQQMYDSQIEANKNQNDAAEVQRQLQLQQGIDAQRQNYAQTNKGLYRDYMGSLQNLPQQLAAIGATGGLSESSRIALDTGYGEGLNMSEMQRLAQENAMRQQTQQAGFDAGQNMFSANQNAFQQYLAGLNQNEQQKYAKQLQDRQTSADTRAAIGDFSGYVELGLLTQEQADAQRKAWIEQNKKLAQQLGYVKTPSGGYSPSGLESMSDGALELAQKMLVGEGGTERPAADIALLAASYAENAGVPGFGYTSGDVAGAVKYLQQNGKL